MFLVRRSFEHLQILWSFYGVLKNFGLFCINKSAQNLYCFRHKFSLQRKYLSIKVYLFQCEATQTLLFNVIVVLIVCPFSFVCSTWSTSCTEKRQTSKFVTLFIFNILLDGQSKCQYVDGSDEEANTSRSYHYHQQNIVRRLSVWTTATTIARQCECRFHWWL